MKIQSTIITAVFLLMAQYNYAQSSIKDARAEGEGSIVTVQGIVTCSGEFNDRLRYIQDETGGLAIFSDDIAIAEPGFEVKVKGTLTQYNELLELVDLSSVEIIREDAPLPEPKAFESLADGFEEANEGVLLKFENITFNDAGTFDAGGSANYTISDGQSEKEVRVWGGTDIGGTPIPTDPITLIGVLGQYQDTRQLQPRSLNDIVFASGKPVISSALMQQNIAKTSFDVCFTTQNPGTTKIMCTDDKGVTVEISDEELKTDHCLTIEDLNPAVIYEVIAESAGSEGEVSTSSAFYMITESESSGAIEVHFNSPVEVSVASEEEANYSDQGFPQIIIDLINKAESTLDIAIYNLDNTNDIISAINDAHSRGITVRMLIDSGVQDFRAESIDVGDNLKISPPSQGAEDGIMHNKFIVVDANSEDPNKSYVLSGSTNWTDNQLNVDPNNIIIIQDQSLAKVYTKEFEEMFTNDLFGSEKTANTPTQLKVGGKDVSVFFSPSDDVETQIKNTISTTDYNLYIALLAFTRFGISFDIEDLIEEKQINAYGIVNDTTSSGGFAYSVLNDVAAEESVVINQQNNIFHHKYLIVDPNQSDSDPTVLTGSHNWSTSAQTRNDENTLIIHDANIANQYYQEFVARLFENSGMIVDVASLNLISKGVSVYPNPGNDLTTLKFELDKIQNYQIDIVDVNGKTIKAINGKATAGTNQVDLKTNTLAKGMYFIQLHFNEQLDAILPLVITE